jgi:hypothetical protein
MRGEKHEFRKNGREMFLVGGWTGEIRLKLLGKIVVLARAILVRYVGR